MITLPIGRLTVTEAGGKSEWDGAAALSLTINVGGFLIKIPLSTEIEKGGVVR